MTFAPLRAAVRPDTTADANAHSSDAGGTTLPGIHRSVVTPGIVVRWSRSLATAGAKSQYRLIRLWIGRSRRRASNATSDGFFTTTLLDDFRTSVRTCGVRVEKS